MKTSFKIFSFMLWALLPVQADAQSQSVQQSGPVTAGHVGSWIYNGILQDAGTSTNPNTTTFGLYGTGTPFCISNTKVRTGQYYQLCEGYASDSSSAFISLTPYGGAPNIPFNIIVDGEIIPIGGLNWLSAILDQQIGSTPGDLICRGTSLWGALPPGSAGQVLTAQSSGCPIWLTPGSSVSNPVRIISSGTTDTATTPDGTIAWNSPSTSPKAQTLYACAVGTKGRILIIKDEIGTAGTYTITVTPASGTIDNSASFPISFNYESLQLQCDGAGNWMTL